MTSMGGTSPVTTPGALKPARPDAPGRPAVPVRRKVWNAIFWGGRLAASGSLFDPSLRSLTNSPAGYLTYRVRRFHLSPYKEQRYLTHDAARLLFAPVLIVIILGRALVSVYRRHAE